MSARTLAPLFLLSLVLSATPAHAYVGPGAGAGMIAVVLGILASIVMGFFAILWYPIKRMMRKSKAAKAAASARSEGSGSVAES